MSVVSAPTSPATAPTNESETQRKAHAKRARETRRSTQGVSADDVNKAKEQLQQKAVSADHDESDGTTKGEERLFLLVFPFLFPTVFT